MHEPIHNNVLLGRTRGWLPHDQQKQRWTKQTTENAKQVTHHNNHSCGTTTKLVTWTSPILWDELVVYIKVITPYPNLPDDAVVSSHGEKDNRDNHHNQHRNNINTRQPTIALRQHLVDAVSVDVQYALYPITAMGKRFYKCCHCDPKRLKLTTSNTTQRDHLVLPGGYTMCRVTSYHRSSPPSPEMAMGYQSAKKQNATSSRAKQFPFQSFVNLL